MNNKRGLFALSPLFVFVFVYLVGSLAAGDFYKIPLTVAFLIASVYSISTTTGATLKDRISHFTRGASTGNLILMLWIFVMAGAFAASAKDMGSIDSTVNLTLSLLPGNMILAGLFIASCFISISIGTSVGTIVALTPIAAGIALSTDSNTALLTAVVVCGAFVGDNLSFISDTTIVATQTQHCRMSDKFRVNLYITLPAAILILIVYIFMGANIQSPSSVPEVEYLKVTPYLVVLISAAFGMNVMAVLTLGLLMTGIIGICSGSYDLYGWFGSMGKGITGMGELIIITMMAGGLLEIIRINGGIDYIIGKLTRHVNGKRGAELSIAALVSLVNACTANNTVAILTVGEISKDIGDRYGLDNRKCASILDTFSCCMQGILPYGAQVLMAAGLAEVNPINIIPYLYYPLTLGFVALMSILLRYPKKYS